MEWSNPASTPAEDIRKAKAHLRDGAGKAFMPLVAEGVLMKTYQSILNERDMSRGPLNA